MITIKPIDVVACIESAAPLVFEHWSEIALNKDLMLLDPNVEAYRNLQAQGVLVGLGAFDDDGVMIGYSVSLLVQQHLHYAGLSYMQNDVIFVTASKRNGSVGMRLIQATEAAARERGAKLMMWHAKQGTALDAVLPRIGYSVQDILYSREV